MPYLINGAVRMDQAVDADEVMERARSFFAARQRGFTVFGLKNRDEDLVEAAEAAGMSPIGEGGPIMAISEPPRTVETPRGMRLETVTTAAQVAEVIEVCADAYAVYGMPPDVVSAAFTPPTTLLADHVATVLVHDEQGPVASAQAVATHGMAYVQWVATKQRAFKRGAGRLATQAATRAGFDLGARLATLLASPMGAPLYRQLGWSDVGVCLSRVAFTPLAAT